MVTLERPSTKVTYHSVFLSNLADAEFRAWLWYPSCGVLALALFQEIRPDFLRVFAGRACRLYVDVLDVLEREMAHRTNGIDREEAIALTERVIEAHQDVPLEVVGDPEIAHAPGTPREAARTALDFLTQAGWLSEEQHSNWRRIVVFDPNGTTLLQALRKIADPQTASFSDKLVNVCVTLTNDDAMKRDPWAQIEACAANLRTGLDELRSMQKSIERHIRLQVAASTLKESMAVLFDQFAPTIGRGCYFELVHARLPTRLVDASEAVAGLRLDVELLHKMQAEVLRREPSLAPTTAMSRVKIRLQDLEELLEQVVPLAETVDRRTADFARRSLARFRYLQDVTGDNRRRIQGFFEAINSLLAGRRITDTDETGFDLPEFLLLDAKQIAGRESLYLPRVRRKAAEIDFVEEAVTESERSLALEGLRCELRGVLTVDRANKFVAGLPASLGPRISSADLTVETETELASILACLVHANSVDANFRIEVSRHALIDDAREWDQKLEYRIERFTLVRT